MGIPTAEIHALRGTEREKGTLGGAQHVAGRRVGTDLLRCCSIGLPEGICGPSLVFGYGLWRLQARALHDRQRYAFKVRRPVIVNGINVPSDRVDLLSRFVSIEVPAISAEERISESHYARICIPSVRACVLDSHLPRGYPGPHASRASRNLQKPEKT
jgi:hypothetical protein